MRGKYQWEYAFYTAVPMLFPGIEPPFLGCPTCNVAHRVIIEIIVCYLQIVRNKYVLIEHLCSVC
jgi:hypothetical protein